MLGFTIYLVSRIGTDLFFYYRYQKPVFLERNEQHQRELLEADKAGF